jgi:hypothetical protein
MVYLQSPLVGWLCTEVLYEKSNYKFAENFTVVGDEATMKINTFLTHILLDYDNVNRCMQFEAANEMNNRWHGKSGQLL